MTSSGVVFPRLVLGYLLALPFVAPWLASAVGGEQGYTFVLRMSSTTGGELQLFYDTGYGYSAQFMVAASQVITDTGFEYRLPLPPARYRSFRIDPATGAGRYTIESASIARAADGSTAVSIPLTELQGVQQLTVVERSPERLVLLVPGGSNDPVLQWTPSAPLTMMHTPQQLFRILMGIALFWVGGAVAAWMVVGLLRKLWPTRGRLVEWTSTFGASNPTAAIMITAFLATVVATYPVLFAGRSFAAPTNGGTEMLYDQPPYLPGADDFTIEDTRGSDVGAMMWQSLAHSLIEGHALATGEVPLWNRYTAIGRPLWGQGLSYILDPLQWLTFLGTDPAPGWDLKFVAHRYLFATGVGLASLAATGGWLPAVIVAAGAPFAGAFSYRFNHPAIFSLTYAPWALLGWFLLAKATSVSAGARAAILLAAGTALLLVAATPKEGAIAVLGISATGALAVLLSVGSWRLRGQRLGMATVAGIAVFLLTAPHWLVFLDTLSVSTHAYETPSVCSRDSPSWVRSIASSRGPWRCCCRWLALVWPACLLSARRQSAGAVVATSAVMAALLLPGGLHVETGAAAIDRLLYQPRPRPRLIQSSPAIDAIHAATTTPTRTTGVGGTLGAGSSVLYLLEDVRGADPLEVRAFRELMDASGMQRPMWWLTSFSPVDVPRLGPMLDMLNVGFLVAAADAVPPGGSVLPMGGPDLVRAIQRPAPWPRAFFTDGTSTYTTPADLVQQVSTRRTPFSAILEGDARTAEATSGLPRASGRVVPADNYVLTSNTTSFCVRAESEGIAVLGETYLPEEFVATLNGTEVPYFGVNHVFKAVRIPGPGEWDVRFESRPRRWHLALGAAALGALILVALVAVARRDRSARTDAGTTASDLRDAVRA